jgi:tetratricopeptide (TPR) repeat protein
MLPVDGIDTTYGGVGEMTRSPQGSDNAQDKLAHPVTQPPTMLKALLQERNLQNYGLFKRAYQKAARALDRELAETYPSEKTFRRWLAGRIKDRPRAEHCTVLEAMLPGWKTTDLLQPYVPPDGVNGSTLLKELLRRRYLHDYRAFCRAYDLTAATLDKSLIGTYPPERVFHRWISGDMIGLPHLEHCNVLETMFPGHSARQLFEAAKPTGTNSAEDTRNAADDNIPEAPGGTASMVLGDVPVWTAVTGFGLPDSVALALVKHLESLASSLVTAQERDRAYHGLVQLLRRWAHTMNRRDVLRTLGWAATAASLGDLLDLDEHERVASALSTPSRIDDRTIAHFETILRHCERQDDALGPRGVLETVLAQRNLIRSLLPECPATLRSRLLSTLSYASNQAGWLSFDLNDFDRAGHYYEDARMLAHEAENAELGACVLRGMSQLAIWRDKPRLGVDHAAAAVQWANRTGDMRLHALCADWAAHAYAADGQRDACLAALDTAHTAIGKIGDQTAGYVYTYDEALHTGIRSLCHLTLGDAGRAAAYSQQALAALDPSFTRVIAMNTVKLGRAHAQSGEIDEAARLLGNAADMAAHHSSVRLSKTIQQGRAELQPWNGTTAVRELDDRLTAYGLA